MKVKGIVRDVDKNGRLVIPSEFRDKFHIENGDSVEIFADNDYIYVRKYNPFCILCGGTDDVFKFNNRTVCKKCVDSMKNL